MANSLSQRTHLRALSIAFGCGVAVGLLIAGAFVLQRRKLTGRAFESKMSVQATTSNEVVKPDPSLFLSLCDKTPNSQQECLNTRERSGKKCAAFEEQARLGARNMQTLLPVTKRLVIEELGSRGYRAEPMKLRIEAVNRIVVDSHLSQFVEVDDRLTSQIRVARDSVAILASDDAAVLVLAHELTHVAARRGHLHNLIANLAATANLTGSVTVTADQREDLACDFIGAEVLKRYIELHPTDSTTKDRLSRALGIETPTERLGRALEDFCSSYNDDLADKEHLGAGQTFKALLANDPELGQ